MQNLNHKPGGIVNYNTRHTTSESVEVEESTKNSASTGFIVSFDKLSVSYESLPFNPTRLKSRFSSNLRTLPYAHITYIYPQDCENYKYSTSVDPSLKNDQFSIPCLLNTKRSTDPQIELNEKSLLSLMKLLLVSSLALLIFFIWTEYFMTRCFVNEVIQKGTVKWFPLHYALILDSILGIFLSSLLIAILFKDKIIEHLKLVTYITIVILSIGASSLVYNFGANILFVDQLEDMMLNEITFVGELSPLWINSQKFFGCCGIVSNQDWNLNMNSSTAKNSYPESCCNSRNSTNECEILSEDTVFSRGCLDLETDMLLGVVYSVILLTAFHFFLEMFTLMSLTKIYFRMRIFRESMDDILLVPTQ